MSITITTWNVQNLTQKDPAYHDKLNFLVGILQALGSDVIALQEILDTDALQELANRLGFQHFVATSDERGNRVAFVARQNIANSPRQIDQWQLAPDVEVRYLDSNGKVNILPQFPRPALQITIVHENREVDIITTHMKSKLLTFGGSFSTTNETLRAHTSYFALERRAAESTSLREHISNLLSVGRAVIVLGDLNDGSEAATTQILYGPPGSQPHGPDDSTRASGAFQRTDGGDGQRLFNITKLIPENIRWSRRYNGQNELLDHILASQDLMPRVNGLRRVPLISILNEDTPNMIGPHPIAGGVIPDHAPVTTTFV